MKTFTINESHSKDKNNENIGSSYHHSHISSRKRTEQAFCEHYKIYHTLLRRTMFIIIILLLLLSLLLLDTNQSGSWLPQRSRSTHPSGTSDQVGTIFTSLNELAVHADPNAVTFPTLGM